MVLSTIYDSKKAKVAMGRSDRAAAAAAAAAALLASGASATDLYTDSTDALISHTWTEGRSRSAD